MFYLLKNPVYRGKIVHKGKVYEGEHEPIVDEALWNQVQSHLAAKAPPRRRSTNEPQQAMLRGLISDPQGRPLVPTYGSSKVKRYAYYETRKDLAHPSDPPGIRFQRSHLEQPLIGHLEDLLGDEYALRRLSGIEEAGSLRTIFATAHLLAVDLREIDKVEPTLRSFVAGISIRADFMEITLKPGALRLGSGSTAAQTKRVRLTTC